MSIPYHWRHLAMAVLTGCAVAFAAPLAVGALTELAMAQQATAPIPPTTKPKPKRNDQSPDLPPQAKPPRPLAPQTPPPKLPEVKKPLEVKKPAAPRKSGDKKLDEPK